METRIPMRVESNELAASPVYKDWWIDVEERGTRKVARMCTRRRWRRRRRRGRRRRRMRSHRTLGWSPLWGLYMARKSRSKDTPLSVDESEKNETLRRVRDERWNEKEEGLISYSRLHRWLRWLSGQNDFSRERFTRSSFPSSYFLYLDFFFHWLCSMLFHQPLSLFLSYPPFSNVFQ